jgi:thioredoxin-like negative regulator of GroEL
MKGNFDSIIQDNRPVVVDFHALWCGIARRFNIQGVPTLMVFKNG